MLVQDCCDFTVSSNQLTTNFDFLHPTNKI